MKSILSLGVLLFCAPGLFASDVPSRTDRALRSRVKEFYDLLIAHKARAAEALVSEGTKDYYYDSQKPDMESFEIENISYGPGFRTAEVTINARMHMLFPGAGPQTVPMKFPSTWKIEDGKWWWYIDRTRIANGPFGQMKAGAGAPGVPSQTIVSQSMLNASVQPDRNQIMVEVGSKTGSTMTFTNHLPGPAKLEAPDVPGLKIEISKPELAPGQSTEVKLKYDSAGLQQRTAVFTVLPTHQQIPIQVLFAVNNH